MTWRKIPEGQEVEWAELFRWLIEKGYITSTDLRATGLGTLAEPPQGKVLGGGQRLDERPDPKKVAEFLKSKGVLDGIALTRLRALGQRPLKDPAALRQAIEEKEKR